MNPQTPHFFIILVHYGSPEPTSAIVTSFLSGTIQPTTIVIIDHATTPYTAPSAPNVQVFRPSDNAGYGAGVNMALGILLNHQVAETDIVITLNNDAEVSPTLLQDLWKWWDRQSEHGLAGVKIGWVNEWTGRSNFSGQGYEYIEGVFLAATYQTWMRLSGLPERYFLYWEDVALSFRAKKKGIILQLIPDLPLKHDYSAHLVKDDKLFYLIRNGAVCMQQETEGIHRLYWLIFNQLRYVYHSYLSRSASSKIAAEALQAALSHKMGKR